MSSRADDEGRLDRREDEEPEDVEAHRRRAEMTDEPKAEDDSSDEVEAHRRRAT
jgi:hypothetical protein